MNYLFNKVFTHALIQKNIVSGFETSGNCKFNQDKFKYDDILFSFLTDRPNWNWNVLVGSKLKAHLANTERSSVDFSVENNITPSKLNFKNTAKVLKIWKSKHGKPSIQSKFGKQ